MVQSAHAASVEPGKQLPNSVQVQIKGDDGKPQEVTVHYMLFVPKEYTAEGNKWPLMLFLHGYGECGNGNDELDRVKIHGPAKLVDSRPDFPFVVVTPQCPQPKRDMKEIGKAWKSEQLIQLIDHAIKRLNVDPERVYVTGLSMGGFGTFRLAAAYPDRFAAAVPICGGGEPDAMEKALSTVPIWAFHGARDAVVPVSKSEEMIDAVRRAGGDVRLTVYPDVEHNSWAPTYEDEKVYDWLLSHTKPQSK